MTKTNLRRGDHRLGARPRPRERKKKKKAQEGEFFGIKQCFLEQQPKGPAWERGPSGNLRPEAPPPLTHLSSLLSLLYFPLISPALPPPPLLKHRALLDTLSISRHQLTLRATWPTVTLSWPTGGATERSVSTDVSQLAGGFWSAGVIQMKRCSELKVLNGLSTCFALARSPHIKPNEEKLVG